MELSLNFKPLTIRSNLCCYLSEMQLHGEVQILVIYTANNAKVTIVNYITAHRFQEESTHLLQSYLSQVITERKSAL